MPLYRKKPVTIQAFRLGHDDVPVAFQAGAIHYAPDGHAVIDTLEGSMLANQGDWIIRGVKGEFYPCRNDIFHKTYEPAEDDQLTLFQA